MVAKRTQPAALTIIPQHRINGRPPQLAASLTALNLR